VVSKQRKARFEALQPNSQAEQVRPDLALLELAYEDALRPA